MFKVWGIDIDPRASLIITKIEVYVIRVLYWYDNCYIADIAMQHSIKNMEFNTTLQIVQTIANISA